MTQKHPITPPPELVEQWRNEWHHAHGEFGVYIATRSARWGADQELEAVKYWLITGPYGASIVTGCPNFVADLYEARRPKPPSLKEQALKALKNIDDACESEGFSRSDDTDIIRRALEALPD